MQQVQSNRNSGLRVIAMLFSSTFRVLAGNMALAWLRLLTVTTAASTLGVVTLGSGYLVERGGQSVMQAAKARRNGHNQGGQSCCEGREGKYSHGC